MKNKTKKLTSLLLTAMLVMGMFAFMPMTAVTAYADDTIHLVGNSNDLETALKILQNGDTIKLTDSFVYRSMIRIENMDITIDLNGYTLTVDLPMGSAPPSGLFVVNGEVILSGEIPGVAELNTTGSLHGVRASNGAKVTVSNATGWYGAGVSAVTNSTVKVTGNVIGHMGYVIDDVGVNSGLEAFNSSVVEVGGYVEGVYAGVRAGDGSTVNVNDYVKGKYYGIAAENNSLSLGGSWGRTFVNVLGDVISDETGVYCEHDKDDKSIEITIDGTITAGTEYIVLNDEIKTESDYKATSFKPGYLEFTDNFSYVWVLDQNEEPQPNDDVEFLQERAAGIIKNGLNQSNLVLNGKILKLDIDGRSFILSNNANNRNIEGEISLDDDYKLVFDIKGNGSNIKIFKIIKK